MFKLVERFITVVFVVTILMYIGLGWLVYAGADVLGQFVDAVQQGGLKSVFDAIWCGKDGC